MGVFVRGDFFFSQLRAETCSGLIKRNKMDFFFPHSCASISQKRQSRGNTTKNIIINMVILKK